MSNKKHHLTRTGETKSIVAWRNVISFLLFISITILSVSACGKAFILNQEKIANCLIGKDYVESLYEDTRQYAYDLCDECSIPTDSVDEVLTFESIFDINEAYICGNLGSFEAFHKGTYETRIDGFNERLNESTNKMIEKQIEGYSVGKNDIEHFSKNVSDYVKNCVEIKAMSKLQTVTNVGKIALVVLIAVSAIISVILILICLLISNKKYRGLRAISYSFISASMLNLVAVIGAEIVKRTKTLYFFPTYLCDAAMDFVNSSIFAVFCNALVLISVAFVIITVGWRLKRDDK